MSDDVQVVLDGLVGCAGVERIRLWDEHADRLGLDRCWFADHHPRCASASGVLFGGRLWFGAGLLGHLIRWEEVTGRPRHAAGELRLASYEQAVAAGLTGGRARPGRRAS